MWFQGVLHCILSPPHVPMVISIIIKLGKEIWPLSFVFAKDRKMGKLDPMSQPQFIEWIWQQWLKKGKCWFSGSLGQKIKDSGGGGVSLNLGLISGFETGQAEVLIGSLVHVWSKRPPASHPLAASARLPNPSSLFHPAVGVCAFTHNGQQGAV